MDADMERLAKLEAIVEAGFENVRSTMIESERRRIQIEIQRDKRQERYHAENSHRLDKMESRDDSAHTKVDGLSAAVAVLAHEMDKIRPVMHRFTNWMQGTPDAIMPKTPSTKELVREAVGDQRNVTHAELKWIIGLIVTCIGLGAGITLWIIKLKSGAP